LSKTGSFISKNHDSGRRKKNTPVASRQSAPAGDLDREIVVVDDCSGDGSAEVVENFRAASVSEITTPLLKGEADVSQICEWRSPLCVIGRPHRTKKVFTCPGNSVFEFLSFAAEFNRWLSSPISPIVGTACPKSETAREI
jgi:hypothetical protein